MLTRSSTRLSFSSRSWWLSGIGIGLISGVVGFTLPTNNRGVNLPFGGHEGVRPVCGNRNMMKCLLFETCGEKWPKK